MRTDNGIHGTSMIGLLILAVLVTASVHAEVPEGSTGPVIGTYDSRAVAVAYYRSEQFDEVNAGWRARYDEAVLAGDSALVEELEAFGEGQQEIAHLRAFSTGDIDEIIWLIYSDLPAVAEESGVDVIVSIWDLVYQAEGMEFVDVTEKLVAFFDPDEETLNIIDQMKGVPPIPSPMLEGIE